VLRLWPSPADLGVATLAGALAPVLERFAGLGMPAALVRQGDGDRRALSTMLWLGAAASCAVLAAMIGFGPRIGAAFGEPIIGSLLVGHAVKLVLRRACGAPGAAAPRAGVHRAGPGAIAVSAGSIAKLVVAAIGGLATPDLDLVLRRRADRRGRGRRSASCAGRGGRCSRSTHHRGSALRYGSQVAGGDCSTRPIPKLPRDRRGVGQGCDRRVPMYSWCRCRALISLVTAGVPSSRSSRPRLRLRAPDPVHAAGRSRWRRSWCSSRSRQRSARGAVSAARPGGDHGARAVRRRRASHAGFVLPMLPGWGTRAMLIICSRQWVLPGACARR
jgi:hypothetical protein